MRARVMNAVLQGYTFSTTKAIVDCMKSSGAPLSEADLKDVTLFQIVLMHWGLLNMDTIPSSIQLYLDAHELNTIQSYFAQDFTVVVKESMSIDGTFGEDTFPERSGVLFELTQSPSVQLQIVLRSIRNSGKQSFQILLNPYYYPDVTLALCCLLRCVPENVLPIGSVVGALIRERGPSRSEIILAIARNVPERFDLIVSQLVLEAPKYTEASVCLHQLANHSPWCAVRIRDALYDARVNVDLVLYLTLALVKDAIDFCTASLRHECSWLRLHFQEKQEQPNTQAEKMRGFLIGALQDYQQRTPLHLAQLLHLYSGVCGMWGLRLSPGSSDRILTALGAQCLASRPVALHGLSFLLVCEGLCKLAAQKVVECIHALLKSPIQALALLVAVRFHAKQNSYNAQWAKSAVGLPVSIHSESMQHMAEVWMQAIPESTLVAHALASKCVPGLRSGMETGTDASALAMKELLNARLFSKQRGPGPTDWLCAQLQDLELPLHEAVPEMIDDYIESCVSLNVGLSLTPMPRDVILLLQQSPRLIVRLVGAYLVLRHNWACVGAKNRTPTVKPYERSLVEGFALRRLLAQAEVEPALQMGHGALLVSRLTERCISDYPEVMAEELALALATEPVVASWLLAEPGAWQVTPLRLQLEQIARMGDDTILRSSEVMRALFESILPQLLRDPLITFDAQVVFASVWRRLYCLHPVQVSLEFLWCVRPAHHGEPPCTSEALIRDPLLVMRVHASVLACAPLYGLVLEILNGFGSASRKQLEGQLHTAPSDIEKARIQRLILAQDCAISQLVIEICANSKGSDGVQDLSCNFLHQVWIQNRDVLPLLLHQGYPQDAVPILVDRVPSMHVCIEDLPSLLTHRSAPRRAWAIYLASFLLKKHPTHRSLEVATFLMQSLLESAKATPIQTMSFLQACAPSLRRVLQAFPVLLDQFVFICEAVKTVGGDALFHQCVDVFNLP